MSERSEERREISRYVAHHDSFTLLMSGYPRNFMIILLYKGSTWFVTYAVAGVDEKPTAAVTNVST